MGLQFEWDEEILTVVYTERAASLRIISARAATKKERMIYYGDQQVLLCKEARYVEQFSVQLSDYYVFVVWIKSTEIFSNADFCYITHFLPP